MINEQKAISDLALIATLILEGFSVTTIGPRDRRGRTLFWFSQTPKLESEILAFLNGKSRVDPKRFYEQIRSLIATAKGWHGADGTEMEHTGYPEEERVWRGERAGEKG